MNEHIHSVILVVLIDIFTLAGANFYGLLKRRRLNQNLSYAIAC